MMYRWSNSSPQKISFYRQSPGTPSSRIRVGSGPAVPPLLCATYVRYVKRKTPEWQVLARACLTKSGVSWCLEPFTTSHKYSTLFPSIYFPPEHDAFSCERGYIDPFRGEVWTLFTALAGNLSSVYCSHQIPNDDYIPGHSGMTIQRRRWCVHFKTIRSNATAVDIIPGKSIGLTQEKKMLGIRAYGIVFAVVQDKTVFFGRKTTFVGFVTGWYFYNEYHHCCSSIDHT